MHLTVVVPLAGPDFCSKDYGIRPLYPVQQSTLIEYVLWKRSWMSGVARGDGRLVFVLRETGAPTEQMQIFIQERFPFAKTVILSELTAGAPFSATAGVALAADLVAPVVIDLADIACTWAWDPVGYFRTHTRVDAVIPYFASDDPKFSYLRLRGERVLEAREKKVISSFASAGIYIFRDAATFLRATVYAVENAETCKVGGAFFVCPSVNGLIIKGREVHALEVRDVEPISAIFHSSKENWPL